MVCALDSRWCQVHLVGYNVHLYAQYMCTGMREHLYTVAVLSGLGFTVRTLTP